MAFNRLFPRRGTVIPENYRPHRSINAVLHELPAFREYTHDLIGVVLYLPRLKHVVVPFRHHRGGMSVVVIEGDATYPRGGHHLDVSDWELQRAQRVVLRQQEPHELRTLRPLADGGRVWVMVEDEIVVEQDPEVRCGTCNVWLSNPDRPIAHKTGDGVIVCDDTEACQLRARRGVYRAPVES